MRTYVRGVAPCPARSAAGLLGLLLLAAAATTRAAAIRGQLPSTEAATPEVERPVTRTVNGTMELDVCAMKVMAGVPPRYPEVDPLHKYLLPEGGVSLRRAPLTVEETEEEMGPELPAGCEDVGRVGHKMLRCSGANMTTLPDLSMERNVDSLVFVDTGIQIVNDVSHLPRAVRALTFTRGPLVNFNGNRLYQVSGLEMLSLEHNTLSTWSFAKAFYSSDAPRNASIRSLYLQYNLISYPVSEPFFPCPVSPFFLPLLPSHLPKPFPNLDHPKPSLYFTATPRGHQSSA